jgi:hypothetical protein
VHQAGREVEQDRRGHREVAAWFDDLDRGQHQSRTGGIRGDCGDAKLMPPALERQLGRGLPWLATRRRRHADLPLVPRPPRFVYRGEHQVHGPPM